MFCSNLYGHWQVSTSKVREHGTSLRQPMSELEKAEIKSCIWILDQSLLHSCGALSNPFRPLILSKLMRADETVLQVHTIHTNVKAARLWSEDTQSRIGSEHFYCCPTLVSCWLNEGLWGFRWSFLFVPRTHDPVFHHVCPTEANSCNSLL